MIIIIIFFISIIIVFGMLSFRAWEIRTSQVNNEVLNPQNQIPELSFRQIEKNMLYFTKHVVQVIILTGAKYWFIIVTKTKKKVSDKWPQIHAYFQKKPESQKPGKPSFIQRAVLESKSKIKRIREQVREDHE